VPQFRRKPIDTVIDVRSQIEFWLGHLPGAVCMPVDSIAEKIQSKDGVTKSSRILVYCASGMRSASAAQQLRALGYTNVVDGGGINSARADFTEYDGTTP